MSTCKEFTELSSDYIDGELSVPARIRALAHLAGCRDCRSHLRQMRMTVRLVAGLRDETIDPGTEKALLDRFRARHGRAPEQAAVSAGDRFLAGFDALLGGRSGWGIAVMALATSVVLAALVRPVAGAALPLAAGLTCLMMEVAAGALPLGLVLGLARHRSRALRSAGPAAIAAAGAVIGQAMLHFTCPAEGLRVHVLGFHLGGVVLAAALGAAAPAALRLRPR